MLSPEDAEKALALDPAQYSVGLTWVESNEHHESGLVHGVQVVPKSGGAPFDVYLDAGLRVLDRDAVTRAGIPLKNWNSEPQSSLTEYRNGPARLISAPSEPRAIPRPDDAGRVRLSPPDPVKIAREDAAFEATVTKGVLRVGVFNPLPEPIDLTATSASVGQWTRLTGEQSVWSALIESPGARGQRIHFSAFTIPPDARVVVYNADNPDEAYDVTADWRGRNSDVWSPTCFSDRVVVECIVQTPPAPGELHIRIDQIIHVYRDFGSLGLEKGGAGACNQDVTCFPDWAVEASGVGGLGAISNPGFLFCNGSLLADSDPLSNVPYLLTAFHCVGNQATADTLEVYWFYQTAVCDGPPPDILTVPRTTGGADFLAGTSIDGGTDFTLLRLRNDPPAGVAFLGWSSVAPPVDENTTAIHHPSGDFKRITFGDKTQDADTCPIPGEVVPERFHQSTWNLGTTEPGSSGSPLFNEQMQIIGQLWGGCASCFDPRPDYYGRFDVTFPVIEEFIGAGPPGPIPTLRVPFFEIPPLQN